MLSKFLSLPSSPLLIIAPYLSISPSLSPFMFLSPTFSLSHSLSCLLLTPSLCFMLFIYKSLFLSHSTLPLCLITFKASKQLRGGPPPNSDSKSPEFSFSGQNKRHHKYLHLQINVHHGAARNGKLLNIYIWFRTFVQHTLAWVCTAIKKINVIQGVWLDWLHELKVLMRK